MLNDLYYYRIKCWFKKIARLCFATVPDRSSQEVFGREAFLSAAACKLTDVEEFIGIAGQKFQSESKLGVDE